MWGYSELPLEDTGSTAQPQRCHWKQEAEGKQRKRDYLRGSNSEYAFLRVPSLLLLNDRKKMMVALIIFFKVKCCISLDA